MKKWNSFAVAGIVLLLILGYAIPSIVMTIEDYERESELKSFEIGKIELNFQNIDIEEELEVFPEMLLNNIVMEMSDTSIEIRSDEEHQEAENETEAIESLRVENGINEFFEKLQPQHTIEFVDFRATYYVMMVSREDERVYPIWFCYGMDEEKLEYRFWLDDMSGKVLAFEIPYEVIGVQDMDLDMAMESMSNYYGYEIFGLGDSISDVYKSTSWQNVLMLYDEGGNQSNSLYLFKVGENFWFNVYPGTVSIYDGEETEAYLELK